MSSNISQGLPKEFLSFSCLIFTIKIKNYITEETKPLSLIWINMYLKILLWVVLLCAKLLQSCLILRDLMNFSPPCSCVHGILQARILVWTDISSSKNLPNSGIEFVSLMSPELAGGFLTTSNIWDASVVKYLKLNDFYSFFCFVQICNAHELLSMLSSTLQYHYLKDQCRFSLFTQFCQSPLSQQTCGTC